MQPELRAIDAYVMSGGRVAFLLNRVRADLQSGQAEPLNVGLDPLLSAWGMGLGENLVMDRQSSAVTVHDLLGLPSTCINFDIGNACLGFLNGIHLAGSMISSGQIDSGMKARLAAEHFWPWNSKAPRTSAVTSASTSAEAWAKTKSLPPVSPTMRGYWR